MNFRCISQCGVEDSPGGKKGVLNLNLELINFREREHAVVVVFQFLPYFGQQDGEEGKKDPKSKSKHRRGWIRRRAHIQKERPLPSCIQIL
jgi:hypothetical protein